MSKGGPAFVLFWVLAVSACSPSSGERDPVVVFAASSLGAAFSEIEVAFEAINPNVDVQLNVAGTSALREQILSGAPADAFASANTSSMVSVADAGRSPRGSTTFATNELEIAVPLGNPGAIRSIEDLADPDLLVGLCAQGVPCGDFARVALSQASVGASIDTNEPDVRALLTKVEAGELDAAIVYTTDVRSSDKVEGIALPTVVAVDISYPIAEVGDGDSAVGGGGEFVAFVLSDAGQAILADHGFGPP